MTSPVQGKEASETISSPSSPNGLDLLWTRMTGTTGQLLGTLGLLYLWGWPALRAMWGDAWVAPALEDPFVLLWGGVLLFALAGRALSLFFAMSASTAETPETSCLAEVAIPEELVESNWLVSWLEHSSGEWKETQGAYLWERGRWGVWGRLFVFVSLVVLGVTLGIEAFVSTGGLWNRVARLVAPWMLFGLLAQLWTPHVKLWFVPSERGFLLYGSSLDGSIGRLHLEADTLLEEFEAYLLRQSTEGGAS